MDPSVITRLADVYPRWWLEPPPIAEMFEHRGRFTLTGLDNGADVLFCQGKVPKNYAAVLFFELWSYTTIDAGERSDLDHPGAFAGQMFWQPITQGKSAFAVNTVNPNSDGTIGPAYNKSSGYNEAIIPYQSNHNTPLIVGPDVSYAIRCEVIDNEAGDVVPGGELRLVSGRAYGWRCKLPPGHIAKPYTRPPGHPEAIR
jgi:hypothetical protein